jgi:ribosome assembly protein RRB1
VCALSTLQAASARQNYLAVLKLAELGQGRHGKKQASKKEGAESDDDDDDSSSEDESMDESDDEDSKEPPAKMHHRCGAGGYLGFMNGG